MNKKTVNNKLLIWTIISSTFCLSAVYLILSATGLKVNWSAKLIQKTGLITVSVDPSSASVTVGSETSKRADNARFDRIFPGNYQIKIDAQGYQIWSSNIQVEGGQAYKLDNIVLILSKPSPEVPTADEISNLDKMNMPSDLLLNGGEIYNFLGNHQILITRLAETIRFAYWHSDKDHIIYQVNNKIIFIDLDGSNPQLITELSNDDPSKFYVTGFGKYLVYKDGTEVKKVKFR